MADTEREAFEAWAKPQPYWWNGQTYSDLHTQIAWEAWQAGSALASRPAQVDDEALPPLPPEVARAMKGEVAFFVKWQDAGKELRGSLMLFTAEQFRQGQRDAVASHISRQNSGAATKVLAPSHTTNKEK